MNKVKKVTSEVKACVQVRPVLLKLRIYTVEMFELVWLFKYCEGWVLECLLVQLSCIQ